MVSVIFILSIFSYSRIRTAAAAATESSTTNSWIEEQWTNNASGVVEFNKYIKKILTTFNINSELRHKGTNLFITKFTQESPQRAGFTMKDLELSTCTSKVNQLEKNECFKILTQRYKIHLMPKDKNFLHTIIKLCSVIAKSELASLITNVKIKGILEANNMIINKLEDILELPKIIIYIDGGRDNAQKALNIIYEHFGSMEGLDRCPRYNQKITSLIYFAQGNAEDKDEKYNQCGDSSYFEQPDRIYFRTDVTGENQDYHLIDPKKAAHAK